MFPCNFRKGYVFKELAVWTNEQELQIIDVFKHDQELELDEQYDITFNICKAE